MMYMEAVTVCFNLHFDYGESNYCRPWGVRGINCVKLWCAVIVQVQGLFICIRNITLMSILIVHMTK
jgi:hypothetical protein